MFGEKAFELIKELKRAKGGSIPAYNKKTQGSLCKAIKREEIITQVLEEMRVLFEENQKEVNATVGREEGLFAGVQLRHASLERDKRCLLAYLYNRMYMLRDLRWELGSVLPQDIKFNLSEQEMKWFTDYNRVLGKYMESIGERGLDLTQNMKPPKSLCIEGNFNIELTSHQGLQTATLVRCMVDYGELEMEDGTVILLKKNSQHFLPRTQCEHLIRLGILQHVS